MPESTILQEESIAIENVFGRPPSWIIYWGISGTAIFLVVCFIMAAFINYPEKLSATAIITTTTTPIEFVAPINGKIAKLFFQDKDFVKEGNVIAVLKDESNWNDVLYLDSLLAQNLLAEAVQKNLKLGKITPFWEDFKRQYKQNKQFDELDISQERVQSLNNEKEKIKELIEILSKQKNLFLKEIENETINVKRSKKLLESQAISLIEHEKAENVLLQQQRNFENINSSITTNQIRLAQLETEILTIKNQQQQKVTDLSNESLQSLQLLKQAITSWKENQLFFAPFDGQISMRVQGQEGIFIKQNDIIATLISNPTTNQNIVLANIPLKGAGNLAIGQNAIIELENYPSNQYGTLKGIVKDIALLPSNESYSVTLELSNEWTTNYNKKINAQPQLKAQVTIYTKEYTLLERIFQNIIEVITKTQT